MSHETRQKYRWSKLCDITGTTLGPCSSSRLNFTNKFKTVKFIQFSIALLLEEL